MSKDAPEHGPAHVPTHVPVKDAASLIVWRTDADGAQQVLLGKRSPTAVFVPDKFVFPGGRHEPGDTALARAAWGSGPPPPGDGFSCTCDHTALALTAIRETLEETGLAVAVGRGPEGFSTALAPDEGWQRYTDIAGLPDLAQVSYAARAVTPPGLTRRYNTRFYTCILSDADMQLTGTDGEFTQVLWASLSDLAELPLHIVTETLLRDMFALQGPANPYLYRHSGQPGDGFVRQPVRPWTGTAPQRTYRRSIA